MHRDYDKLESAHTKFPSISETVVAQVAPETITIDGRRYEIVTDFKNALRKDLLAERYEEVLDKYDYLVGDWGYEQLRLKGFYEDNRKQAKPDQEISHLQDYLYEFCNFGCAYFVLQRLDAPVIVETEHKRTHRGNRRRGPRTMNAAGSDKPVRTDNQRRSPQRSDNRSDERRGTNAGPRDRRPAAGKNRNQDRPRKDDERPSTPGRSSSPRDRDRNRPVRDRAAKPYSERRTRDKRPERGKSDHAESTGKQQDRHFTIRKLDEETK